MKKNVQRSKMSLNFKLDFLTFKELKALESSREASPVRKTERMVMREIQTQTDTSPETKSPRKTVYSKSHPQTVRNRAESRKEISAPTRHGLKIQFKL